MHNETEARLHCSTTAYRTKCGSAYHQARRLLFPYEKTSHFKNTDISTEGVSDRPHVEIDLISLSMVQQSLKV